MTHDIPRKDFYLTWACGCVTETSLPVGPGFPRQKQKRQDEAKGRTCPTCRADRLPSRPRETDDERFYDGFWRRKSV